MGQSQKLTEFSHIYNIFSELTMFSKRANVFLGEPEFLMGCLTRCVEDAFDKESNKEGFVNLGTAVNSLCEDIIKERLNQVIAGDNSKYD